MTTSVGQERMAVRKIKRWAYDQQDETLPSQEEVVREIVTAALPGVEFDSARDMWSKVSVNGITFRATTAGYRNKIVRDGQIATIAIDSFFLNRRVNVKKDGTISLAEIRDKYQEILDQQIERKPNYLEEHRRTQTNLAIRNALAKEYEIDQRKEITLGIKGGDLSLEFYGLQEHQVRHLIDAYLGTLIPI